MRIVATPSIISYFVQIIEINVLNIFHMPYKFSSSYWEIIQTMKDIDDYYIYS